MEIFLSVYTSGITMGKEGMRKKKKLFMLIDGIADEIDLSLISIGISFSNILSYNLASEPISPSPPFLLPFPLFFSTNINRNPHPLFFSRIKLPSLQIWPLQHSVSQHSCSGLIVFRILHIK